MRGLDSAVILPPLAQILMTSAPSLMSVRTALRNSHSSLASQPTKWMCPPVTVIGTLHERIRGPAILPLIYRVAHCGHHIAASAEVAYGRQAAARKHFLGVGRRAQHLLHIGLTADLVNHFLMVAACRKAQVNVSVEQTGHQAYGRGIPLHDRAVQVALVEF